MLNKNQIFLCGGAVRDKLLGLIPNDLDYVVVGSSPKEMLSFGFSQVGADFPVFLHPETNDEYALARTERKSGNGYHGFKTNFSKEVTIEDDLERRDISINSMALDYAGILIDPYNGQYDLEHKIIRHTSDAFSDDPVRVFRTARFAARFSFNIHEDTNNLMINMVKTGELDHLTPERIWLELEKGAKCHNFDSMIFVLREIGALDVTIPELLSNNEILLYLKSIDKSFGWDFNDFLVMFGFNIPKEKYNSYKIPNNVSSSITSTNRLFNLLNDINHELTPELVLKIFKIGNLRRNHTKFTCIRKYVYHLHHILISNFKPNLYNMALFIKCIDAYLTMNVGVIALGCKNKQDIKSTIISAELIVIKNILNKKK